jgi:hypothetical protein
MPEKRKTVQMLKPVTWRFSARHQAFLKAVMKVLASTSLSDRERRREIVRLQTVYAIGGPDAKRRRL